MASEDDTSAHKEFTENKTELDTNADNPDNSNRSKLIAAATVFLNSKRIRDSPMHLKRSFLEKKGLTPDEIDTAFELSNSLPVSDSVTPTVDPIPSANEESVFKRIRGFIFSTVAFTGTALAVFEVFQRYVGPWLAGDKSDWQERLVEGQTEISENMASLVSTVNDLRRQMSRNSEERMLRGPGSDIHTMKEIREDLKTLKSVMLGRNQFPPVPQARPALPSWQLENKTANGRADLELSDGKYCEKAVREVLIRNKMEHCNGSHGNDVEDRGVDEDDDRDEDTEKPPSESTEAASRLP